MTTALALRLPTRRLSKADIVWLAFVAVQAMDGAFSYVGVSTLGDWIEANPLVAWYATMIGPGLTFIFVKLFAIACGALLYLTGKHRTMAMLTMFYLAFAVVPWMHVLGIYR